MPWCWEAEGKEMLTGCSGGSCWQKKSIPMSGSDVRSYVGEWLMGRACMGGCSAWPLEGLARQHSSGCVMLPADTEANQGWFRKGFSLGSRYWGLSGLRANGSTPLTVPRHLLVMLDQTMVPTSLAQSY